MERCYLDHPGAAVSSLGSGDLQLKGLTCPACHPSKVEGKHRPNLTKREFDGLDLTSTGFHREYRYRLLRHRVTPNSPRLSVGPGDRL